MRSTIRMLALGAVALAGSSCAFERTVLNEGVEKIDTSGIVAGETSRTEVLMTLGAPPVNSIEAAGTRTIDKDYFSYAVLDRRCFRFGFEELWLITPFRWCSTAYPYRLAVEFDEDGVVSGIYKTRRENIWRPFESDQHRRPPVTTEVAGDLLP